MVDCQSVAHNRVMVWIGFDPASFANGAPANAVIGQPDFTTGTPDTACGGGSSGATNPCGLDAPIGLDVDPASGRLFVADMNNHRVLVFDDATLTNGEAAVRVIGQPDFVSDGYGTSRTAFAYPEDVVYQPAGDYLLVVDDANHRALIFGAHVGDDPLVISGGTGTSSGNVVTIVSSGGNDSSVTFPPGTGPLPPATAVTITVGDGGGGTHPSIVIDASLPTGTSKTVTMAWYDRDICIDDSPGATITTQGGCLAPKVRVRKQDVDQVGECRTWEGADTVCRTSASTLTISGLEHSAVYAVVDSDGDGIPDDDDVCPSIADDSQEDADGDLEGDACDLDDDNDSVPDASDNCPFVVNPAQIDLDFDGFGDDCDLDDDADGVADLSDNCPSTLNPDQSDSDADLSGDACDLDDDNDGVADAADNCRTVPNPSQSDGDHDGPGDACDADDDNDGVADAADYCPDTSASSIPGGTMIYGCNAEQILACKPGDNAGEARNGLSTGTKKVFSTMNSSSPTGRAAQCAAMYPEP